MLLITMMQYKYVVHVLMPKSPVVMAVIVFQLIGFNFMIRYHSTSIGLDSLLLIVHALKVTTILKLNSLL